jgi:4-hydroxy-4-methyl-2-oxoglutarate aldolase
VSVTAELCAELARLGAATVYEAAGRQGLVDAEFHQLIPGSRACGPARTGDLLATQAQVAGAVAVLNDAAARDTEELREMGLPVWTRYVRSRGARKEIVGALDVPVTVGGQEICSGDLVVLDADGVTVVAAARA